MPSPRSFLRGSRVLTGLLAGAAIVLCASSARAAGEAAAPAARVPAGAEPVRIVADKPAAPVAPTDLQAQAPAEPLAGVKPVLSPMMLEMTAVMDAEQKQLGELTKRFKAAGSADAALAAQREIEQLKVGTEVKLLQIQAAYARREGRKLVADRIDAAIRELTDPPLKLEPVARPGPSIDPTNSQR